MPHARISITLPPELLAAADRQAAALDRSRSWIIAEALRLYVESEDAPTATPSLTAEVAGRAYGVTGASVADSGLGDQRLAQLEADLALTPEQRVREAERTLALSELRASAPRPDQLLTFDTFEEYLAWKRFADLSPP